MTKDEALKLALEVMRNQGDVGVDEWLAAEAAIKQALAQPVQSLPFGVGGGLVAIKTLLSRDPCVHANTAIEMLDAILKEHPAAQPAPVQEPVAQAWAEGYRAGIDDERTSEANIGIAGMGMKVEPARNNPYHTTPPAQPAPVQEPVAWVCYGAPGKRDIDFEEADINKLPIGTLLYTTPFTQPAPVKDSAVYGDWDDSDSCGQCGMVNGHSPECRHLYTTPPAAQRPWVGLTDEELKDIELGCHKTLFGKIEAMQKVEAKLKEKNT
jgi:hypothetical protein